MSERRHDVDAARHKQKQLKSEGLLCFPVNEAEGNLGTCEQNVCDIRVNSTKPVSFKHFACQL